MTSHAIARASRAWICRASCNAGRSIGEKHAFEKTSASLALAAPALARDVVIHAGTLIDGVSTSPREGVSIQIKDDRIIAVTPGFVTPAGADVIDLADSTVMPGFIDAHVHIAAKLPSRTNMIEGWLTHSDIDRAFDGAKFARAMLQQGFTAARDVGGGEIYGDDEHRSERRGCRHPRRAAHVAVADSGCCDNGGAKRAGRL